MDIFTLAATIGIDLTAYEAGINRARNLFDGLENLLERGLVLAIKTTWEFGKDVIKTGSAFDKQMSAVQAVLGKEEGTVENMQELRERALAVAEDSVFTSEEVAKAYYYMGMAGWKTEKMLSGLPGVIALAAASGEDLAMVSDIVTDSLTAFGLSTDYAQYYADILAQTATNSNTDVARMGKTFQYMAPIAGQLGVDVDDVALSIGLMANSAIKGGMAGTAFRQILTRIATNAGATSKTLGALEIMTDKLGVSVFDTSGNFRDWSDILEDTRKAWGMLSPADQIYYAKQIASLRGVPAWLALMNASQDDWESLSESLANAGGAAQTMADVRLDNLAGDVIKLGAAFDVMKIAIYDDVKGPLRDVVQYGTESIKRITDAINERGLVGGIEQLGVEIENMGDMLSPVLESIGKAAVPIISGLLADVGPQLISGAVKIGISLGAGIIQGISDALSNSDNPLLNFLGDLTDTDKWSESNDWLLSTLGNLFGFGKKDTNGEHVVIGGHQWLIDELANSGGGEFGSSGGRRVVIGGHQQLIDDLANGGGGEFGSGGGRYVAPTEFDTDVSLDADEVAETMASSLETGITTGSAAGAESAKNSLVQAGKEASAIIESSLMSAIANGASYDGVIVRYGGGWGRGRVRKNARAMQRGYVFNEPTIIGYAEGQYQMAGDAGPEAVVGVNSLGKMVQTSVNSAMGDVGAAVRNAVKPLVDAVQNLQIILDSGVLVGEIASQMDTALNDIAEWKGGGRAG